MKVHIGDFVNWVGPYQLADLLQYVGVSKDRCHSIGKKLSTTWVNTACERIHDMKKRNVKVHIDPYDSWECFGTISLVIEPLLQNFISRYHGYPSSLVDPKCYDIEWTEEYQKEQQDGPLHQMVSTYHDDADKQWKTILDKMLWSFHAINNESDLHFDTVQENLTHNDRVQEGLELFAKYFQSLWI